MNSAEGEVLPLHDLLKLPPHLPQRVGGLTAGLPLLHKPYFHRLHIIRTFLCDEPGGHHPREGLVALLHRPIEIPAGRKKVRATDNPHDHRALAGMELRSRLAEIRPRCLLHPISTRTIVDAVQVIREDLILRVVGLDPQCQRNLQCLPVQRFRAHLIGVAGELHGQGRGSLGEIPILHIAHRSPRQAPHIHPAVLEKPRILARGQRLHHKVRYLPALHHPPPGLSGHLQLLSRTIMVNGGTGQLRHLIEIESRGEDEIEKNHSQPDHRGRNRKLEHDHHRRVQPRWEPSLPTRYVFDGSPG